ncbi:MAG: serine/threonine-protein kinase [Nannocystaceae bacterium]
MQRPTPLAVASKESSTDALTPMSFRERYRVGAPLGGGGMGVVTIHEDRQIGRSVALKRLRPELRAGGHDRERFLREARTQGQLEHPSVVPVYDLGLDDQDQLYFTMKRIRGITLEEILERLERGDRDAARQFSRRRLLAAFSRICLAVDYAHERGVLHRDLKPANMMLGDYGEVYVLDWGIATTVDAADHERSMGTPGYMAPEAIEGDRDATARSSDLYSLGAILFELLTYSPLHAANDEAEAIRTTLTELPPAPSRRAPGLNIPPELDAICLQALAQNPRRRYESARALHDAIEGFLDGERDEQRRRQLADEHADKATAAARRALEPSARDELGERRAAMGELGRALALDPQNKRALEVMVRLLVNPPRETPAAMKARLEQTGADQRARLGGLAAWFYLSLLFYLPLFCWAGLRAPWWPLAFYGVVLTAAALCFRSSRDPQPSARALIAPLIASSAAMGLTTFLFGPLIGMPAYVAINASAYGMMMDRRHRGLLLAVIFAVTFAPLALELLGVLAPSYAFSDAGMLIIPRVIDLSPAPTYLLLGLSAGSCLLTATVFTIFVADVLHDAHRRVQLQSWHLEHMIPRGIGLER